MPRKGQPAQTGRGKRAAPQTKTKLPAGGRKVPATVLAPNVGPRSRPNTRNSVRTLTPPTSETNQRARKPATKRTKRAAPELPPEQPSLIASINPEGSSSVTNTEMNPMRGVNRNQRRGVSREDNHTMDFEVSEQPATERSSEHREDILELNGIQDSRVTTESIRPTTLGGTYPTIERTIPRAQVSASDVIAQLINAKSFGAESRLPYARHLRFNGKGNAVIFWEAFNDL